MFGLFNNATITDSVLGELRYSKGRWRGLIELAGASVPLAIAGIRKAPDEGAIEAAKKLPVTFAEFRPQIESALFEHYEPYAEAIASGELKPPQDGPVEIYSPAEVWRCVVPQFVSVEPMMGKPVAELGLAVYWDEEHTLGARLDETGFFELCGSVVPS